MCNGSGRLWQNRSVGVEEASSFASVNVTESLYLKPVRFHLMLQVNNALTSGLLPAEVTDTVVAEVQRQVLAIAEAQERDIPAAEVQVDAVEAVKRDAFVTAATQIVAIREHFKMALLTAPRADNDMSEAEVCDTSRVHMFDLVELVLLNNDLSFS